MDHKLLPNIIPSQKTTLKKHDIDTVAQMFQAIDQDRMHLVQFLPWVHSTKSVKDCVEYITRSNAAWGKESFEFSVFCKTVGLYLGNIGALSLSRENKRCEIGFWISPKYERKGYISDALAALETSLFENGFNRNEIRCSSLNTKSMGVAKRNGYELEAHLKQKEIKNGAYRDTLVFAKLATNSTRRSTLFLDLNFIYLFTPNLKASRDWYARLFEIEPYEDLEDYVEFRPNGVSGFCLHHADAKSPLSSGGSVGYWRVLDFQTAIAHFEKNGAKVYRGPIEVGGGKSICQMIDPIGNVVGLIS